MCVTSPAASISASQTRRSCFEALVLFASDLAAARRGSTFLFIVLSPCHSGAGAAREPGIQSQATVPSCLWIPGLRLGAPRNDRRGIRSTQSYSTLIRHVIRLAVPQLEHLQRLGRAQPADRQLAAVQRRRDLLIDRVVVEADRGGIRAVVGVDDLRNRAPTRPRRGTSDTARSSCRSPRRRARASRASCRRRGSRRSRRARSGSPVGTTWLTPSPMILPSRTTTAPNGPSSELAH